MKKLLIFSCMAALFLHAQDIRISNTVEKNGVQEAKIVNGTINRIRIDSEKTWPAGDYTVSVEMRGKGEFASSLNVFLLAEPRNEVQAATWSSTCVPSDWMTLERTVRLAEPGKIGLVLTGRRGKWDSLELKNIGITPRKTVPDKNLLPDDGFFRGKDGDIPAGWDFQYAPPMRGSGITREFGLKSNRPAMSLVSGHEPLTFCSQKFYFPEAGTLNLTVHARAKTGSPQISLRLIGDQYNVSAAKSVILSSKWQKYTLRLKVPDRFRKYPTYWLRIDLPKESSVLIGRLELTETLPAPEKEIEENRSNRIVNPDFLSGAYGWTLYTSLWAKTAAEFRREAFSPAPEFRDGFPVLFPTTSLCSSLFPITPGREYTVLCRIRSAAPGKSGEVRLYGLDGRWNRIRGIFTVNDQWQTIAATGKFPVTPRNMAYWRIDTAEIPIQIARAACFPGRLTEFPPEEPLRFGLRGKNIVDDTDRDAALELRVRMADSIQAPVPLTITVKDLFGKTVRTETVRFSPAREHSRHIRINPDGLRGTFFVTLEANGKTEHFTYAVLKNLDAIKLKENPLAGHVHPGIQKVDRKIYDRYFGFRQMTFNRFFMKDIDLSKDPDLIEVFRSLHPCNVLSIPGLDRRSEFATDGPLTPELRQKFEAYVRQRIRAFRGAVQVLELFNEPELWRYQDGPKKNMPNMPIANVVEYYRIARKVMTEEAPEMKLAGPVAWKEYGERFLKAGGGKYIDIFAFHAYNETPDMLGVWQQLVRFRELIRRYAGKELPLWNTEQYYGIKDSTVNDNDPEWTRSYFARNEHDFAAVCAANLIHYAAGGSHWAVMVTKYFWRGLNGEENVVTAGAASVNAAIEQLHNAGRGREFPLGDAVKCFLFPNAEGGALATIHATDSQTDGELEIPAGVTVFDMAGNPVRGKTAAVTNAPVYLRFAKGTAPEQTLSALKFRNLGSPLASRLIISGQSELTYRLTNRTNRPEQVSIRFLSLPENWEPERMEQSITLKAGETANLRFRLKHADPVPMRTYRFKAAISGPEYREETSELSVLLVQKAADFNGAPEYRIVNPAKHWHLTEKPGGPGDLSAAFSCIWNETGFGVRITVQDDVFCFPDNIPGGWQFDSVQLYFDMKRDATAEADRFGRNRSDDVNYLIGWLNGKTPYAFLDKSSASRFIGASNQTRGIDGAVKTDIRRIADNRICYTVFFPAETLPDIRFEPGTLFGFSILVNDNDGKGRKGGLTLAPPGEEPFNKPHRYMDVVLTAAP